VPISTQVKDAVLAIAVAKQLAGKRRYSSIMQHLRKIQPIIDSDSVHSVCVVLLVVATMAC
jgi:hypothetical protein